MPFLSLGIRGPWCVCVVCMVCEPYRDMVLVLLLLFSFLSCLPDVGSTRVTFVFSIAIDIESFGKTITWKITCVFVLDLRVVFACQ